MTGGICVWVGLTLAALLFNSWVVGHANLWFPIKLSSEIRFAIGALKVCDCVYA